MTFEEILETQGKLIYTNVGISMLPWIHEGKDVMVIEKAPEHLRKNDVVLFVRPRVKGRGKYVLHRIIRCYEDGSFFIRGDNTITGERVLQENIIGILTSIRQPGRTIHVTDRDYRCKVWLWWHFCLPAKTLLWKARRMLVAVIRRIFRIDPQVGIRDFLKGKIGRN